MPYNTKGIFLLYVKLKWVLLVGNLAINITAVHEKHNGQWRVPDEVQINMLLLRLELLKVVMSYMIGTKTS